MIKDRLTYLIISPCITEKSTRLSEFSQYVFEVGKKTSKAEIVRALKLLYNVDVVTVRICNVHGKRKRFRGKMGKPKGWRKAYVSLVRGQTIDLNGA